MGLNCDALKDYLLDLATQLNSTITIYSKQYAPRNIVVVIRSFPNNVHTSIEVIRSYPNNVHPKALKLLLEAIQIMCTQNIEVIRS